MRKCVTCGILNTKRKFIDVQCEDCYNESPVSFNKYTPASAQTAIDQKIVDADLAKIDERNKKWARDYAYEYALRKKAEKISLKKNSGDLIKIKESKIRQCNCGARIQPNNEYGKCRDCLKKAIRAAGQCYYCNLPETPDNPFNNQGRRVHISCIGKYKHKEKLCKVCGDGHSESNPLRTNKKGNHINLHIGCTTKKSLEELYLTLPEEKICHTCGDNKPISDYYFNKGGAYNHCKKCHYKKARAWQMANREHYLKYLSSYHKEYIKKLKETGKKKLHENRPLTFINLVANAE